MGLRNDFGIVPRRIRNAFVGAINVAATVSTFLDERSPVVRVAAYDITRGGGSELLLQVMDQLFDKIEPSTLRANPLDCDGHCRTHRASGRH